MSMVSAKDDPTIAPSLEAVDKSNHNNNNNNNSLPHDESCSSAALVSSSSSSSPSPSQHVQRNSERFFSKHPSLNDGGSRRTDRVTGGVLGDSHSPVDPRFNGSLADANGGNRIVKTSSQSDQAQFATNNNDQSIVVASSTRTATVQGSNHNNTHRTLRGGSRGEQQDSAYENKLGTRRNRAEPLLRTQPSGSSSRETNQREGEQPRKLSTHTSEELSSNITEEKHDNNHVDCTDVYSVSSPSSTTETSFLSNRTMGLTNVNTMNTSSTSRKNNNTTSSGSTQSQSQSHAPQQQQQHHRTESSSDASSAWKNLADFSEKMESSTQRTERSEHDEEEETIATNSMPHDDSKGGDDDDDDDDNSTIRSLDSATAQHDTSLYSYSSASSTPLYGYTIAPTTATMAALESSSLSPGMRQHQHEHHDDNNMSGMTTALTPPLSQHSQQHLQQYHHHHHPFILGTPSTTSTAPSTADDGSFGGGGGGGGMDSSVLGFTGGNAAYHHRVPSWEGLPQPQHQQVHQQHSFHHPQQQPQQQQQHSMGEHLVEGSYSAAASTTAWGPRGGGLQLHPHHAAQQQQQQRVASFRDQGYPPMAPTAGPAGGVAGGRWQTTPPQTPQRFADAPVPFLPTSTDQTTPHGAPRSAYHSRHQLLQQQQQQQQSSPSFQVHTPPRGARSGSRLSAGQQHALGGTAAVAGDPHSPRGSSRATQSPGGSTMPGGGGARSSSEVLKTLLRKKACLYEPDTSRAVTLITWLVGRHLALENGFFSRQQLQAGVHSCVASKIASGVITRTKVNRCMQIILNSCFHYIIPRPDGTEENGSRFRDMFAKEVSNDEFLLQMLPSPWNDMTVDREAVLKATLSEDGKSPATTPQPSPQLTSRNATEKNSPGKESADSGDKGGSGGDDGKRAVLLCFNENVRCAEDVFRCHNEFIRDTAHATHLQLSSLEWRNFFGKEAAGAPYLWGNVGIPVPHQEGKDRSHTDALGVLTNKEAAVLRTSWCAKRYDHNHELCGFAHSEVNGGWLRRNPLVYDYKDEMCPSVSKLAHERSGAKVLILNECPHGLKCSFAHSVEEILYHPRRYKARLCQSSAKPGGCKMGDVCPHFHPMESYRFPKKSEARSPRHARQAQQVNSNKGGTSTTVPAGAPILYASPAPLSSFDEQLLTPGLQSLYRRHCAVSRALIRSEAKRCYYSYFGDDAGVEDQEQQHETTIPATNVIIGPPAARSKR